jgi:hypothetical protein
VAPICADTRGYTRKHADIRGCTRIYARRQSLMASSGADICGYTRVYAYICRYIQIYAYTYIYTRIYACIRVDSIVSGDVHWG